MAEPWRRKARARALAGLSATAALVPGPIVRGGLAGLASLAAFTRYERLALANLELALGAETTPAERRRIARGVRRHAARILAEWLRLARSGAPGTADSARGAWIDRAVELDPSIARLEEHLSAGRGALIVTAHIGNWELLCARLARLGLKGAVVGRFRPADSSSDWIVAMRRAYGVATLPQSSSARDLLAVLRRGEVLGILADLEVRRLAGLHLPFFGVPALTMTAPAALARAAGLPLIPVRCVARGPRAPYRLAVDEPLSIDPALDRRAATADLTARLNRVFERWIREAPEQWAWHQPRWRTPPGERAAVPLASRRGRPARTPG